MRKVPAIPLTALLAIAATGASAEDIILRLRPDVKAPIITRITATEKVLLNAAPAAENSDWKRLDLKVPFEGYVPEATLTKGLAIIQETPVHFLPDAGSETITRAKDGDLYEVKRVEDKWATIRFQKELTTYFRAEAAPSAAPVQKLASVPEPPELDLSLSPPTHSPEPKAADFDPNLGVGKTSPDDLPPENVTWKSARSASAPDREPQPQTLGSTSTPERPDTATPRDFEEGTIMVSPDQTQAREADAKEAPPSDKPLRLLVGTLIREIETTEPAYPIRLQSDEGRLIAYVDFSGYFIEDLSPYLDQRVYLRGHLMQAPSNDGELVLFVRNIQIAE